MDIREFLEARLAEDEATARSALQPAPWWPGDERTVPTEEWTFDWHEVRQRKLDRSRYRNEFTKGDGSPYFVVAECHPGTARVSRHIARHDPARVLRDVEAKRRVLVRHQRHEVWAGREDLPSGRTMIHVECSTCRDGTCWDDYDATCSAPDWPCAEVRDVASAYADHPDYDPSWSPS